MPWTLSMLGILFPHWQDRWILRIFGENIPSKPVQKLLWTHRHEIIKALPTISSYIDMEILATLLIVKFCDGKLTDLPLCGYDWILRTKPRLNWINSSTILANVMVSHTKVNTRSCNVCKSLWRLSYSVANPPKFDTPLCCCCIITVDFWKSSAYQLIKDLGYHLHLIRKSRSSLNLGGALY